MTRLSRLLCLPRLLCMLLLASALASCGTAAPPSVTLTPRYPDYVFPGLTPPPDARLAGVMKVQESGWRWLQAGDLDRAQREFESALKRSPAFYPSEAALGYVALARNNHGMALTHFDRVLTGRSGYVPALLGRGEALLGQSREADALAAFEAALAIDPALRDVGRRVEVLRARMAQENVAAAQRAAQAGRLDEAAQAYAKAIATSPDSAFLFRDLADVESKQGKAADALEHYHKAIQLDPGDVGSRVRVAEILEAADDVDGALAMFNEANRLEPRAETLNRIRALEARAAYLRLPAEYRELPTATTITRGDLAALIAIRLEPLLATVSPQPVVLTDTRNHWATRWINATANAGVMNAYDNHTFQPRNVVRRSDLAQAVSRMLKIIASRNPALLKDWQSRQQKIADVGVSNLNYADASLSVAAGVLPLDEGKLFQLSRPVAGSEAIDAVGRIERLFTSSR